MTKKKWLYVIGIIIIVVPILFFYNAFNGNPVSKFIATKNLEKHLDETYPSDDFNVGKPFYDFKREGYDYDVAKIGEDTETKYDFLMVGVLGTTVSIDGIYDANQDTPLINKLQDQAAKELTSVLESEVTQLKEIEVGIEVLKGSYNSSKNWSKDFEPERPMYIHMMFDSEGMTKEEVLDLATIVQKAFNDNGYNYDTVTINGAKYNENVSKDDSVAEVIHYVSFSKDTVLKLKNVQEYKN